MENREEKQAKEEETEQTAEFIHQPEVSTEPSRVCTTHAALDRGHCTGSTWGEGGVTELVLIGEKEKSALAPLGARNGRSLV